MEIQPNTHIAQTDDQVSCELDGETVLLRIATGMYYGYNGVASRIWELIEQPRTLREICDQLTREFEVDAAQCEVDVRAFLAELATEELIELRQN